MKSLFPGYFKPSEEEYAEIWANALIVPNTNVLLNLYRYSEMTSDEFLSVLEGYSASLWLPYRVAAEFFEGRATVISGQAKKLQELVERTRKVHSELNPRNQHPLINSDTAEQFGKLTEEVVAQLENNSEKHRSLISSDSVLARIAAIFEDDKIGRPYDVAALEDIIKEGALRYAEKIPPGFKDEEKGQSSNQSGKQGKPAEKKVDVEVAAASFAERCRPFGDLIIWKEILRKATAAQRPVVFITGDSKVDWWEIRSGITVGPRPELVKEFQDQSGQKILIYSPERFLTFAKNKRDQDVTDAAISEVKEVSEQSAEAEDRNEDRKAEDRFIELKLEKLNARKARYQSQIDSLSPELSEIEEELRVAGMTGKLDNFDVDVLERRKRNLMTVGMGLMRQIQALESEIFHIELDRTLKGVGSRP